MLGSYAKWCPTPSLLSTWYYFWGKDAALDSRGPLVSKCCSDVDTDQFVCATSAQTQWWIFWLYTPLGLVHSRCKWLLCSWVWVLILRQRMGGIISSFGGFHVRSHAKRAASSIIQFNLLPNDLIYVAVYYILCQSECPSPSIQLRWSHDISTVYVNSMLESLNSRKRLRKQGMGHNDGPAVPVSKVLQRKFELDDLWPSVSGRSWGNQAWLCGTYVE